eukprot:g9124.t1
MAGGFEALGLAPELVRAVTEDLGYLLPTNVQDEAIPLILGGGDVMVAAETGSGKTAAFSLPLLQIVQEDLRGRLRGGSKSTGGRQSTRKRESSCPRISRTEKDGQMVVSADGLSCQCEEPKWAGARGEVGVRGGVHCFEVKVDFGELCRFGWATQRANFNLGTDAFGYGFGGTAMKSNGSFEKYGETFTTGDRVGCRLDLVKGEISFSKNGKELGVAFKLPSGAKGPFFPAVALKSAQASFDFTTPFAGSRGATPLASASPEHAAVLEVKEEATPRDQGCAGNRTPVAIILEPARELAEQVSDCLTTFKRHLSSPSVEHALLVGGTDFRKASKLAKSPCDVVVGTPGRVLDFLEKGSINPRFVRLLVLDEADQLLQTDQQRTLAEIYQRLPQQGVGDLKLQVCFFSATLHSPEIAKLADTLCDRPTWVDLKGRDTVPQTVHHVVVRVDPDKGGEVEAVPGKAGVRARTDGAAVGVGSEGREAERAERLKRMKPQVLLGVVEALGMDQALIFCRTNLDCDLLEEFLTEVGGGKRFTGHQESGNQNAFSCCVLAGMRSMQQRRANLLAFKEGDVRFLICTDVAARGVDIKGLPYVVNMTLPDVPENYIHRIGRVGRQDCLGLAVSIVACDGCKEKVWYHKNCRNRGQGCTNREILSKGGCTVWYDEPGLLKEVESLLQAPIPELGPGYSLPESLQGGGGEGAGGGAQACPAEYGAKVRGDGGSGEERARLSEHVKSLRPAVQELAGLEFEAQNIWLGMMHGNASAFIAPMANVRTASSPSSLAMSANEPMSRSQAISTLFGGTAAFAVAAAVAPGAALADGAVSGATQARARGIYGGRIAALKGAVDKGDASAVLEEQNCFRLFNSGVYSTDKAKFKQAEELAKSVVQAASAGDAKALKESYAAYMKYTEKKSGYNGAGDGQGLGSEFDYKNRTPLGTVYQR